MGLLAKPTSLAGQLNTIRLTGQPDPSGASQCRGGFSVPPALGALVRFSRSKEHHPETGTVWGRQFGTGIVEIVDQNGKPLRLMRGQYEVVENARA